MLLHSNPSSLNFTAAALSCCQSEELEKRYIYRSSSLFLDFPGTFFPQSFQEDSAQLHFQVVQLHLVLSETFLSEPHGTPLMA